MQTLIVALFGYPIRWWPWLQRSWRAKLSLGLALLGAVLLYPIASLIWSFPVFVTVLWSPCPLLFGWLAGRLIGEAAIQKGEERASAYLKRIGGHAEDA